MTELNKGEKETLELRAPCAAGGVGAVGFLLVPLGASGLSVAFWFGPFYGRPLQREGW